MKKNRLSIAGHVFLSFMFVFIMGSGSVVLGSEPQMPSIDEALTLMSKGQYLRSLIMFKDIAMYSDDRDIKARAIFYAGKTYSIYLDQQDTALDHFNEIIYHYSDNRMKEPAMLNSGIIYFNRKQYKKAYPIFTDYLEKYPDGRYSVSAKKWADISKEKIFLKKRAHILSTPIWGNSIEDTNIRVLIRKQARKVRFESKKTIQIFDSESGKIIYSGWGPVAFEKRGKENFFNNERITPATLTISSDIHAMRIDNQLYRGFFTIHFESEGLLAVNHVPLESYLYSVVPKEMPNNWAMHALMAQAVAARTYALYMKEKNGHRSFDLEATTASQVYGGYLAETRRSTQAVNATRGQVMTYDGRLILAYFHSNSGGYTEDPVHVWDTTIPYLRGVPDQFSENTPESHWEYFLSYKDAAKRLKQYGLKVDKIQNLRAAGRSKSGRNLLIKVVSDKGITYLNSNHFRESVGETKLKSTLFKIIPSTDGILFKGKGYGHGVGMSQWGANHMALSGASYTEILKHYYQGIDIVTLES